MTFNGNDELSTRHLDFVFVIDATGTTGKAIKQLKEQIPQLLFNVMAGTEESGYRSRIRVRIVDFADYASEAGDAIHASRFFSYPDELDSIEATLDGIRYLKRGGDVPENGLEALYVAMQSEWVPLDGRLRGRHDIILLTDAPPLPLGVRTGCLGYPEHYYPETLREFEDIWNEDDPLESLGGTKRCPISSNCKRLVLIAPDEGWSALYNWDLVLHYRPNTAADSTLFFDVEGLVDCFIPNPDREECIWYDMDDDE